MITRVLVGPLPHGLKHVLLDLDVLVADGWVMEGAEDVVDDFVHWYACVLPGIQHAAAQGSLAQWLPSYGVDITHGTVYCKMVDATLPAHGLRMLVKWSLDSIE